MKRIHSPVGKPILDNDSQTPYVEPMPKLNVESTSQLSAQESYDRVKNLLQGDTDIKNYDPDFAVEFDDSNMCGKAKGKLFKADLKVEHSGAYSTVSIALDIPMKLALAKGLIQKKLQGALDSCLS